MCRQCQIIFLPGSVRETIIHISRFISRFTCNAYLRLEFVSSRRDYGANIRKCHDFYRRHRSAFHVLSSVCEDPVISMQQASVYCTASTTCRALITARERSRRARAEPALWPRGEARPSCQSPPEGPARSDPAAVSIDAPPGAPRRPRMTSLAQTQSWRCRD